MTAKQLLARWAERDRRYRTRPFGHLSEAMVTALLDHRHKEALDLPEGEERDRVLFVLSGWVPPQRIAR